MSELHTRKEKRTPVTLKIKFKSATLDQFIERYSVDVSHGGIFIRTKDPLAVGTQLRFEFQLQDSSPLISGDGTVVWTREFDPSRVGVAPGMGVRFDRLAPESQPILEQILNRKPGGAGAAHAHDRFESASGSSPGSAGAHGEKTRITPPTLANSLAASTRLPSSPPVAQGQGGVSGRISPTRSFVEEAKDATPLPKPMPFHGPGDAEDEFNEDVFEQPTKVASLETLLKHEEEHARQAQAGRAASVESHDNDEEDTGVSRLLGATQPRARAEVIATAAAVPSTNLDSIDDLIPTRAPAAPPPLAQAKRAAPVMPSPAHAAAEPRFLDAMNRDRGAPEVRVASDLVKPVPARPGGTTEQTASRRSTLPVLLGALVLVGAAAAVYFLVIAPGSSEEQPQRPPPRAQAPAPAPAPSPSPRPTPAPVVAAPNPTPTPTSTPPAPVAPAPTPAERAKLQISVSPAGADVMIDGAAAAAGSVDVDVGKHEVTAVAACFRDQKVAVDLKSGESRPVALKLKPLDRVVRVSSDPPSAQLLVDGRPAGRTPTEIRLVGRLDPRARHTFVVRRPGFQDTQTVVAPDAACATEGDLGVVGLRMSLTPLRGRPTVAPHPKPPAATPPPPAPTPPAPAPTPAVTPPAEEPKVETPPPAETKPEPSVPVEAPRPTPIETKPAGEPTPTPPAAEPAKPVETKPEPTPAPAPTPPKAAAPETDKKDCDPSPDAPEWARCK